MGRRPAPAPAAEPAAGGHPWRTAGITVVVVLGAVGATQAPGVNDRVTGGLAGIGAGHGPAVAALAAVAGLVAVPLAGCAAGLRPARWAVGVVVAAALAAGCVAWPRAAPVAAAVRITQETAAGPLTDLVRANRNPDNNGKGRNPHAHP